MSVSGFIYVLENESMPGIVKIGMTTRLPEARAAELWTTGVPTPFTIAFSMYCEDPSDCETAIHQEFDYCRVNGSREFFRIDTKKAVGVIAQYLLSDQFELYIVDADCYIPEDFLDKVATACNLQELWMVGHAIQFFTRQEWLTACDRAANHHKQNRESQSAIEPADLEESQCLE